MAKTVARSDYFACALIIICLAALVARLWFNFYATHPVWVDALDGSEYVRDAVLLSRPALWQYESIKEILLCFSGLASVQTVHNVQALLAPLSELQQAGFVYPLFIAGSYCLAGQPVNPTTSGNWQLVIFNQCLLSTFTCLFIGLTARKVWSPTIGLLAASLSAIYPAFIVNTARLYSENLAVFFITVAAYLTVSGFCAKKNRWRSVLLGLSAAALQLTRSVMFLFSLLLLPVTFWQNRMRKPWRSLLLLFLGFALFLAPLFIFQKVAFHQNSLIVDRAGGLQIATGNNYADQGWLSFPFPALPDFHKCSEMQILAASIKSNPKAWLILMLDKPIRLFKFPWNDFRASIGPFTFPWQIAFHQALLLLAFVGLAVAIFIDPDDWRDDEQQSKSERINARLFLASILFLHCIYMLFITVGRYAITAMPFLLMFAAAGATNMYLLLKRSGNYLLSVVAIISFVALIAIGKINFVPIFAVFHSPIAPYLGLAAGIVLRLLILLFCTYLIWYLIGTVSSGTKNARLLAILVCLIILPSFCLPARAHGRWNEFAVNIDRAGTILHQNIDTRLSAEQIGNSSLYLLLDAANAGNICTGWQISVNGSVLKGPALPGIFFDQDHSQLRHETHGSIWWEGEYIVHCLALPSAISVNELRQWYFIPVPREIAESAAAQGKFSIELKKVDNSLTTLYGSYHIKPDRAVIPSVAVYCWDKAFYGVEDETQFCDPRLDQTMWLTAEPNANKAATVSGAVANTLVSNSNYNSNQLNIRLLITADSKNTPEPGYRVLRSENLDIPHVSDSKNYELNETVPALPEHSIMVVRLRGEIRSLSGNSAPHIALTVLDKKGAWRYFSPWVPSSLDVGSEWRQFDVAIPVPCGDLPGKSQTMQLAFTSYRPDQHMINAKRGGEFAIRSLTEEIGQITPPLKPGWRLF